MAIFRAGVLAVSALWSSTVAAQTVSVNLETFSLDEIGAGSISYSDSSGSQICTATYGLTCVATYDTSATVSLTAVPNEGSVFSGWYSYIPGGTEGGGPCDGNTAPTCTFPATELTGVSYTISADFSSDSASGVPPTASSQTITISAGTQTFTGNLPAASDSEAVYTLLSQPEVGSVSLDGRIFQYINEGGIQATDGFTWSVTNSFGANSYQTTFLVDTSMGPIGQDYFFEAVNGTVFSGTLPTPTNFSGAVTYSLGSQSLLGAEISINPDGTFTYLYGGEALASSDSFDYTITDDDGSSTYTVNVGFEVNSPPFVSSTSESLSVQEDSAAVFTFSVFDTEGDDFVILQITANDGTLEAAEPPSIDDFGTNISLSYTPSLDFSGTDFITVEIQALTWNTERTSYLFPVNVVAV
uniref:Ig-like domain-containing protein n=1 Tax=Aequoribacter sp. TaxID=2847771 RepID=UPI003F69DF6F